MVSSNMNRVKLMVLTAIFAALSIVVGFVEIPWPPMPFLKIDFSEVIILIALLTIGFPRTVVVIVLRSLVREFLAPKPFEPIPIIGEVMAILGSIVIISLYRMIFSRKKEPTSTFDLFCLSKQEPPLRKILKSTLVAIGFSIFMTALNFFLTVPLFLSGTEHIHFVSFVNDPAFAFVTENNYLTYTIYIVSFFLPFNLVKGALTMLVFDVLKIGLSQLGQNETFKDETISDSDLLPGVCEDESLKDEKKI